MQEVKEAGESAETVPESPPGGENLSPSDPHPSPPLSPPTRGSLGRGVKSPSRGEYASRWYPL